MVGLMLQPKFHHARYWLCTHTAVMDDVYIGQLMCDTLNLAEDAEALSFALSSNEVSHLS